LNQDKIIVFTLCLICITFILILTLTLILNKKSNELNLKCNNTCNDKGYFSGIYNSTDCICYFMSDQKMVTEPIEMTE